MRTESIKGDAMTKNVAISLERCLSCGDSRHLSIVSDEEDGRVFAYHVECDNCGARGRNRTRIGWCESEKEAAEAWNDRTVALSEKTLISNQIAHHYSIEPHGPSGEFALYLGRSISSHGFRLCQLSDFSHDGEKIRVDILLGLNTLASSSR